MNDQKSRVGDYLPPGVPEDDETAGPRPHRPRLQYPERMTVSDLAKELGDDGDDWIERAVRDLAVTALIRCEQGVVFATFGFPDLRYPEQPGSH